MKWNRSLLPRSVAGDGDTGGKSANHELLDCCRELGDQSRKLNASLHSDSMALAQSIATLLQEFARTMATDAGLAIVTGSSRWTDVSPQLQEQLMAVGQKALSTEPEISLRIADTVLAARSNSRAAWRLRARALEELGDLVGAIKAHEGYLSRISTDKLGAAETVQRLRQRITATEGLAKTLSAELAAGQHPAEATPTEELWDSGVRLEHTGQWPLARAQYLAAILRMIEDGAPPAAISSAVEELSAKTVHHEYDRLGEAESLLTALAAYRSAGDFGLMDAAATTALNVISVGDFRNLVAGKTICLVANSERVAKGRYGSQIDEYDLVVRFNSYAIDPPATGRKTDIHATIHLYDFNWDKHVPIRLVLSGSRSAWVRSLKQRLVPGAQDHIGDNTLRWPARDARLVNDQELPGIPTSGFNILRLLDFLDVSTAIDLFGFDFYETGPYRVKEAMKLAVAPIHSYDYEKEWVLSRATSRDEMRISLR